MIKLNESDVADFAFGDIGKEKSHNSFDLYCFES